MHTCTINFKGSEKDLEKIKKIFGSEKKFVSPRSKTVFVEKKKSLVFLVEAKDAVALRASTSTILKNLAIYEKVRGLK